MSYKQLIDKNKTLEYDEKIFDTFYNNVMTSTLQEEFYSTKDEQTKASINIHNNALKNNRELYSTCLLLPINDIHKMLIIKNLLENKVDEKVDWENNLILDTLIKKMPIHRTLKLLYVLAQNKTNNARIRWLARQLVRELGDKNIFLALKYKRLMKVIFKHYHVDTEKILKDVTNSKDIWRLLFEKETDKIKTELYKDYLKAKKDKNAVYKLPISIALGFKELHKISDDEFYSNFKSGNMSNAEKRRFTNKAKDSDVDLKYDVLKDTPINILKHFRSTDNVDRDGFETVCKREAEKLFNYFDFKNVKIIVDNSGSMYGSDEKKYHPITVAEGCAHVLKYLSEQTEIHTINDDKDFLLTPDGNTDISKTFLKVLKELDLNKDGVVIIISDGYDNINESIFHQVVYALKKKLDKKEKILIIHLNPVFDSKSGNVRKLSELIKTYGIRDTRQLFLVLLLSLIANKKDKKIRKIIEEMKKKVVVRKKKKKVKKND